MAKIILKSFIVFAVFCIVFISSHSIALADDSTSTRSVTLTIRSGDSVIWAGQISIPDSDVATTTITATDGTSAEAPAASVLAALVSADAAQPEFSISNLQYYGSFSSFYLKCITVGAEFCDNWQYVVNNTYPSLGMDRYILHNGDVIYLYFGSRRRVSLSTIETIPAIPAVAHVESYNYTDNSWSPLDGETVGATKPNSADPWNPIIATTTISGADGVAMLTLNATGTYNIGLASDYYSTTTPLTVRALAPDEVTIRIRNGVNLAYQGIASISTATTSITATDGSTHSVSGTTPLAVLTLADNASDSFGISNLQYFSSLGSFYVKCLTISVFLCDNWQYAVNGAVPGVGADTYNLAGGEDVFFFYGYPRRVSLSSSSITMGSSITATAETYSPSSDIYVPTPGLVIGATQPDPANPWTPIEIATSTSDANGQAIFTLNATGTYQVGIQADSYFPTTDLTITTPVQNPQTPIISAGGGVPSVIHRAVDVDKAAQFLIANELQDGSFGSLLYTDWAAIALASNGNETAKVSAYLKSANSGMSVATDYERHAMALMVLGINPYTDTSVNYIQKIVDTFDGIQIGDTGLVNDDIFSLFPLTKAGYASDEPTIQKITSFILSKQLNDGSWERSADLTAAGIQALSLNTGIAGVSQAITKARAYLSAHQGQDGGFGTSFSTSWVLQAISALHESESNWTKNNNTPNDYLFALQAGDGGIEPTSTDLNSRIWATSYAIPAALNKSWGDLLHSFSKPAPETTPTVSVGSGDGGESPANQNKQVASTTTSLAVATSSIEASSSIIVSTTPIITQELSDTLIVSKPPVVKITKRNNFSPASHSDNISSGQLPKIPTALPLESSINDVNKGPARPVLPQLASIATFGHNLFNFAANVVGLIISNFFSIIKLRF